MKYDIRLNKTIEAPDMETAIKIATESNDFCHLTINRDNLLESVQTKLEKHISVLLREVNNELGGRLPIEEEILPYGSDYDSTRVKELAKEIVDVLSMHINLNHPVDLDEAFF